jgi:hypothetical protein
VTLESETGRLTNKLRSRFSAAVSPPSRLHRWELGVAGATPSSLVIPLLRVRRLVLSRRGGSRIFVVKHYFMCNVYVLADNPLLRKRLQERVTIRPTGRRSAAKRRILSLRAGTLRALRCEGEERIRGAASLSASRERRPPRSTFETPAALRGRLLLIGSNRRWGIGRRLRVCGSGCRGGGGRPGGGLAASGGGSCLGRGRLR